MKFLFPEKFVQNQGVYFHQDLLHSEKKQTWDDIADNWVATGYRTEAMHGLIESFVENVFFDTILELGCGFGRGAQYLSAEKNISCNFFYATDISENMLRRLVSYRKEMPFFEEAQFYPICLPVGELPFEDDSIDLVFSDSVFMHVGHEDFNILIAEARRVLKPNGKIFFQNSFHNRKCPTHFLRQLRQKLLMQKTVYSENYSGSEIIEKLTKFGLSDEAHPLRIEASQYQVFPGRLMRYSIFQLLNALLVRISSKNFRDEFFAFAYSAYSPELLQATDCPEIERNIEVINP